MDMKTTCKRKPVKRKIRDSIRANNAKDAIGELSTGCEIYGLTGGQWSLVDLLDHCLDASGPSDVVISTWTAATADLSFAEDMINDGRIKSLRFIVDKSFKSRQPAYFDLLVEKFGQESIRITSNHCKFILIGGEKLKLIVRTSMNLNMNKRAENFEISEDHGFYEHMLSFANLFYKMEPGLNLKPSEHTKIFKDETGNSDASRSGLFTQKGKIE